MKDPNSIDKFSSMPIVPNFILMGVCYLTGLAIYVYQCPERFKPGQYDILVNKLYNINYIVFTSYKIIYIRDRAINYGTL